VRPIDKALALLTGITRNEVERLRPEQRKRLASVLRTIADLADPPRPPPKPRSGVLSELRHGRGRE
jgi:hypothetical protein